MKKLITLSLLILLVACKKKTKDPEPTPSTTGGNTTPTSYTLSIKITPQSGYTSKLYLDWNYKYNAMPGSGHAIIEDTTISQLGVLNFTKIVTNDTIAFLANSIYPPNTTGPVDVEVKINNVIKGSWTNETQPVHYVKVN